MRLALITPFADSRGGGVYTVVAALARELAALGHDIHLIGRVDPGHTTAEPPGPVMLHRAERRDQLAGLLARVKPDLLHSHGLWDPYLMTGLGAARRMGLPAVISPHGMLDTWALRQSAVKKRLALAVYERRNLHGSVFVHALTEAEAAAIRAVAPRARITVLPNGVALPDHLPQTEETPTKTLLFLGRIHPKKGLLELIDGFARITSARPDLAAPWRIMIAGWDDGGHQAAVKARIAAHGLSDRISLIGPVFGAEKTRVLSGAAGCVLTSHSEGLPMSVLEAWSFGKPVLMSPACNLGIGAERGAALLCPPDPGAIARGLEQLFAMTPQTRAAMGAAGADLVAGAFSWPRVAARFAEHYRSVPRPQTGRRRPRREATRHVMDKRTEQG